jgi:hemoglobin
METAGLYERIGGAAGIDRLVDEFYGRVLDDPSLAPFFRHAPMEHLRSMQREFFAVALGGPGPYTGRPMSHVHHGRGIERAHFARFVEHLFATLQGPGLAPEEVQSILRRVNTYVDEIVSGGAGEDS